MVRINHTTISTHNGAVLTNDQYLTGWDNPETALKAWKNRNQFHEGTTVYDFEYLPLGVLHVLELSQ